jgi:hypothetical protein
VRPRGVCRAALHLAVVFGISERAAMRYADADADRAFLETPLEQ